MNLMLTFKTPIMKKLIAIAVLVAAPALFAQEKVITTSQQNQISQDLQKAETLKPVKATDNKVKAVEDKAKASNTDRSIKSKTTRDAERKAEARKRSETQKAKQKLIQDDRATADKNKAVRVKTQENLVK